MNNLSWIIYLADVLPSMAEFVFVVSLVACFITGFFSVLYFTAGFGEWTDNIDYINRFKYFPHFSVVLFVVMVLCNLTPNKETFYMIAASESGEQVLKTPEATKLRAVINKWLDDQVSEKPE